MKKKLMEYAVLGIGLLAITFMLGFYFGQKQVQHITITAEKGLQAATAQLRSQTPESATIQTEQIPASEAASHGDLAETASSTEAIQTVPVVLTPININTADVDMLDFLPGIGPALAQRIVTYREANGPFGCIEDIKNVSGIGDKKFEAMKSLITVEEPE